MTVEGRGTVLAARETPQNKRFPELGGHWILELDIEEWSAGDGRPQPEGPLRLIVPRELIDAMMPAPAVGERLSLTARLVVDKPNTARAAALMRVDSDDSE